MATINTSTIVTIPVNYPQYYHQFKIIHDVLVKISFPYIFTIAFIGLITNTSTVILLSKNFIIKTLKNKWTLIALALSDLLFNTALLIRGIHDITKGHSENFCLIISYLSNLAEILSACYTVSFTVQRYIAVRHPFKAVTDHRSSPIISLLLILVLCSIFCFVLCYSNIYVDCHEELKLGWFIADALVSFIIPFSLILIFNILIIRFIRKHSCSPISVHSTLLRNQKKIKNNSKNDHHYDTCETDNPLTNCFATFTLSTGNERIEKKNRTASFDTECQTYRSSISLSFRRAASETLPTYVQPQSGYQSAIPLTGNPYIKNESFSSDSFIDRLPVNSLHRLKPKKLIISTSTRTSQSIRVTRMLILVSTCFLVLNAPSHICIIILKIYTGINIPLINEYAESNQYDQIDNLTYYQSKNFISINEVNNRTYNGTISSSLQHVGILEDQILIHILYMAVLLTQLIAYASYSINFFLYSFSGIAFRTSLRQLMKKLQKH